MTVHCLHCPRYILGQLLTRSPLPPPISRLPLLPGIRPSLLSQLDTVVCRTNLEDEGMAALVLELRPERWKVQVREER